MSRSRSIRERWMPEPEGLLRSDYDSAAPSPSTAGEPASVSAATALAVGTGVSPWQDFAACIGIEPDLFFPRDHERDKLALARSVCAGCVVRDQCLEFALTNNERHGVWGGRSERERRRIRRQRRAA